MASQVEGCANSATFKLEVKVRVRKVLKTFEGVEKLSLEQMDGIVNFIRHKDVLAVADGLWEITVVPIDSWTVCGTKENGIQRVS